MFLVEVKGCLMAHAIRLTPAALDAEMALLGCLLLDDAQLPAVAATLPPPAAGWFSKPAHALIYDACLTLFEARRAVDLVTVTDVLQRRGHLAQAGGAANLAGLMELAVSPVNAPHYAAIVREKGLLRQVINISTQM
jgi:replicative DNA helicase